MSGTIVVAVHPDDETLGCGGLLLKRKEQGRPIHWLIMTGMKEKYGFAGEAILKRDQELRNVEEAYGFDTVTRLDLPPAGLDDIPLGDIVSKISETFTSIQPAEIILPFHKDVHSDHRTAFNAAYSCTKTFRSPFIKRVLMMETLSETEFAPPLGENAFLPNFFVDITNFMEKKIEILGLYANETAPPPFPRNEQNLRALATFRGAMAGCLSAESFMLLKEIQ